jgi:hypothetical protein
MDASEEIIQLKVRLLGISPMIWRRVVVPTTITLRELHGVLQVAMGWEGIHLFLFYVYTVRYGSFELHAATPDVSLQEFGLRKNARFSYIYDMGDHWEHEIRVEAINPPAKQHYPTCIGGSGACPPEDCGGVDGYLERRDEAEGYCSFQRRPVPMGFVAQKSVNPFPMDVSRPLGLEKVRDRQPHQCIAHRRGIKDVRVEQERVLAHFEL